MQGASKILYCTLLLFVSSFTRAQNFTNLIYTGTTKPLQDSTAKLHVKNIIVKGNKKTKEYIILREMQFKKGDSLVIADINKTLELSRQLVYNTALFSEVTFEQVILSAFDMMVVVDVKERWYIYPIPQFKLVDRNFNEWIKTYNASLKRANYGLKFTHDNFSGRRDKLRIFLVTGFSRDFSFSYTAPYSNKSLTEGFVIGAGYSQKKEIPFKTTFKDSLLFFSSDSLKSNFVGSNFYIDAAYTLRRGFFNKHYFNAGFTRSTVSDSILLPKNNANYFNSGKTVANIFDISYTYQYTNVNNALYATKGKTAFFTAEKRGLGFTGGINAFTLEAGLNKYNQLSKRWFTSQYLAGKITLPLRQAFINQRGLGYGDNYLRGQEYLVINGVATALLKSTLKYKVVDFKINLPFKIRSIPYIPFTIFVKTYTDLGYTYNKKEFATNLNNKLLYTGGFGIDIVTFYDLNFRIEYSFNQLNQKGLFLHNQTGY
jgi:outer membrane protein assembly factor BamA